MMISHLTKPLLILASVTMLSSGSAHAGAGAFFFNWIAENQPVRSQMVTSKAPASEADERVDEHTLACQVRSSLQSDDLGGGDLHCPALPEPTLLEALLDIIS